MPPKPMPVGAGIEGTKCQYFLGGSFDSSSWRLPYLSANLSIKDAAEYLSLASEIPGLDETDWRVEEIYQRDIDWPRVKTQIVPYLRSDKAKFFNAITVVLIPKKPYGGVFSAAFSKKHEWNPPASSKFLFSCEDELLVGPIRLGYFGKVHNPDGSLDPSSDNLQAGLFTWNRDQVHAIAIDGQHRLAAIKELAGNNGADPVTLQSKVPVIFLVFHDELGFRSPVDVDSAKLLRSVFIDLNKHAQSVNRARQILLDDRDPQALCVRALISDTLAKDVGALNENPPHLPLSLVDWHSEQAKFDRGPYLTTVLGLDYLVMKMLGTKDIKSYTDFAAVKKQVAQLQKTLKIDLSAAVDRISDLEQFAQTPFAYHADELKDIVEAFKEIYSAPLISLLTRYSAYNDVIKLRENQGSLRTEWQHWYRLFENEKSGDQHAFIESVTYKNELQSRVPPVSTNSFPEDLIAIENVKNDSLAFAVVFQKSIVEAYMEFTKLDLVSIIQLVLNGPGYSKELVKNEEWDLEDLDAEFDDEPNDYDDLQVVENDFAVGAEAQRVSELCSQFLPELDRVFSSDTGLLKVTHSFVNSDGVNSYFWQGSLLKPGGAIDFTQAAVSRAKDLIYTAVVLSKIRSTKTRITAYEDFDYLWDEINDAEAQLPKLVKRFSLKVKTLSGPSSIGGMILSQSDLDYDMDKARDQVRYRMKAIWDILS